MPNITHIISIIFLPLALILLLGHAAFAQPDSDILSDNILVNIDAQIHVEREKALVIPLQPGTYKTHVIGTNEGGEFDAYNLNCSSLGCDAQGNDCRHGWQHAYTIYTGRLIKIERTGQYATPELALKHLPADQMFELDEAREVEFYIYNPSSPRNNQGGISLLVESSQD